MYHPRHYVGASAQSIYSIDAADQIISKKRFWKQFKDKNGHIDKRRCAPLKIQDAHKFVKEFLPAFGFYRYRESPESPFIIIQKCGPRVKRLGLTSDRSVRDALLEWTLEALRYLPQMSMPIPTNLEEELFAKVDDFFDQYVPRFLTELPSVDVQGKDGRVEKRRQVPIEDSFDRATLCFQNGVLVLKKNTPSQFCPYNKLPANMFVWESWIYSYDFDHDSFLEQSASGKWWDFIHGCCKEKVNNEWVVNPGIFKTLTTSFGYLMLNFKSPSLNKAICIYDRTQFRMDGGNGKSLIGQSLGILKPVFYKDMKREGTGDNRFFMSGFTADKRIIHLDDPKENFDIESQFNRISDGFTVEEKNAKAYVIASKNAPKMLVTSNHIIDTAEYSKQRRVHYCPITTHHKSMSQAGKPPSVLYGGDLFGDYSWDESDFQDFFRSAAYCLQSFLDEGLVEFEDSLRLDQQVLLACDGDEFLHMTLVQLMDQTLASPDGDGGILHSAILAACNLPELERYQQKDQRTTASFFAQKFKTICSVKGVEVNPGETRRQRVNPVNGKKENHYRLVPRKSVQNPDDTSEAPRKGLSAFLTESA